MSFFNNLSVKKKFVYFVSFMVLISIIIGVTGGVGIRLLNLGEKQMYENRLSPIVQVTDIIENLITASSSFDIAILVSDDAAAVENYRKTVEILNAQTTVLIDEFAKNQLNGDMSAHFDNGKKIFAEVLVPNSPKVFAELSAGNTKSADDIMDTIDVQIGEMVEHFNLCKTSLVENAKDQRVKNVFVTRMVIFVLIAVLLLGIFGSVFIGKMLSLSIRMPMQLLSSLSAQVGDCGNMRVSPESQQQLEHTAKRKDEFGSTATAFSNMFQTLGEKATVLESIAQGDLSVKVILKSKSDTVGISLDLMVNQLNDLISQISFLSGQVSLESKQIADSSQSMALGSEEQNSVVEGLSKSIMDVEKKTKANATMADQASSLNNIIKSDAEKGSVQMQQMTQAVQEINTASQSIKKVIKVIDDIAFQTNILALNAAVEAARAGQHGKGFAVVADEVRNLAAKSAEAAKDTESLISNSIERADFGAKIAGETATSLVGIVNGINQSSIIVDQIVKSSHEQAEEISQINSGIGQVNMVVQQNSALSQELAASSIQMSGQSQALTALVSRFKLNNSMLYPSEKEDQEMRLYH